MAELKIGGSDVVKIMYGDQEIGGATKLEPGTILHMQVVMGPSFENIHLFSTTKNWSNIDGIHIEFYSNGFGTPSDEVDISGDDFKNLDIAKEYNRPAQKITVSRSIVDGEYMLNIVVKYNASFLIKAI